MGQKSRLVLITLALIAILACNKQENSPSLIPTHDSPQESNVIPEDTIYFGFITRYNPKVMYEEYQPIMDYMSAQTPYHFEIKLGKTYEDAVDHLGDDLVQISSFGAVTYIEASARFNAIPLVKPLNENGSAYYRSLIICREDSDIRSISDLRGKSFAFASEHSTSGNLIPRYTLLEHGIKLEELESYVNLKHHDSVARGVLSGKFDAGAVKDIIGNRYVNRGLRVVDISKPIPSVPLVIKSNLDSEIVNTIKQAFLKLNPADSLDHLRMQNWNSEFRYGFVEAYADDYEEIRDIMNRISMTFGTSYPQRDSN